MPASMIFSDLIELKRMLEIDPDDDQEDVRLNFWLKIASGLVEGYLGYPVFRQERTEYYNGTGTQKIVLRTKPAYLNPTPRVWVQEDGLFGATSGSFGSDKELVYGQDFGLWLDDGSEISHRAMLIRKGGLWNKSARRQAGFLAPFVDESYGSIKVTYVGGYYAEDLPEDFMLAAIQVIARLRFMMPLGLPVGSDSFGGRSISIGITEKNWLLGQTKHLLFRHRNRRF